MMTNAPPQKSDAPYPYLGVNGAYYDRQFLDSVWSHLEKMTPIWSSGLDAPSPVDRFAYDVLKQITMRRPGEERSS